MHFVDMLTINEEPKNTEDLMGIVREAVDYFPEGIWEGINYLGSVNVKYDLEMKAREKVYRALIFDNLMTRIREMKNVLESRRLLLAVTHDPVISIYHRFELEKFKRIVNLVRDYVSRDVGIISLFEIEEEAATRIAAHGLGHNQGLKHHATPIDLMYAGLLDRHPIRRDGFCDECQRKLEKRIAI